MLLKLLPAEPKIDFVRHRRLYFMFSFLLLIAAAVSVGVQGLKMGIDFQGGILVEVRKTDGPADIADMRSELNQLGLGEIALQGFGNPSDVLIRVQRQPGGEEPQQQAIERIQAALGDSVEYRRIESVGPKVGSELIRAGTISVVLALLAIMIYVWFRFEWQFGLAAVLALAHDVLLTVGLFSVLQLDFNLATVAAVLTVAGYSINDTVVVFDRVRENFRKYKKMAISSMMNLSINETLSRTTLTSITTLLALIALFIWGGQVIRDFSIALIWGVVIGTYSSICVAVPLLLHLNVRRGPIAGEDKDEQEAASPASS